ncbi:MULTISPECIES: ADP/ATP-dependent (S)-NAD(P)H-hydrate dehydratase [unclassified Rathayibacter]|uniref:ADP-dependent NAD(P)H-hydrate dehydratase n=1 Tax=unclassified Rathayibacter TaxID=2609250 RepID=UPI000F4B6295|nr:MULTISPECIES: ADP/ATP-dependent (S)-NAD(P)H-hydrate dehydratase [unclassified Rathayibacter]ROP57615.1 NAD(P)H-hydrate repair Nnr-like enzyme with NAD(P)H-hydrate dehydratase domain [Rathayibacter sp. PhB186]ROS56000.1 NAD(P)H-hydrate repair Nnr-like enzyme with NAD(P)H-hydrate dehydratase domain [Rathayibacter sp. PhB185]
MTDGQREFGLAEAALVVRVPRAEDDKYSRGVLGIATGSERYPGAAVLGVEAAVRTGLGMVRYVGPERPSALVLARRPEVVTSAGRVQAWLLGSGTSADDRSEDERAALLEQLHSGVPVVLDAGALDLIGEARGPVVVTPHYRELAGLLTRAGVDVDAAAIAAGASGWARRTAERFGVCVLLKGSTTHVVSGGTAHEVSGSTPWLATAGSGDVLGGVLGALLAGRAADAESRGTTLGDEDLAAVAAAAAVLHAQAGAAASGGGPIAALDIAEQLPGVVARLLN